MSKFRTIEVSNPRFETCQLRFMTVKSNNLQGRGDICVFVPSQKSKQPLPIVILLHGVYGSSWSWALQGGVHLLAKEMMDNGFPPMILAMPSDGLWGDGSGYLKHRSQDFEKWIAEDVPQALSETIEGVKDQSSLFITGLSMGGYGALRIGMKFHQQFRAIAGHSSIIRLSEMRDFVEEDTSSYIPENGFEADLCKTAKMFRDHLPPIYFDCGTDDPLIESNRLLHSCLQNEGIVHTFQEFPGRHEWPYWEKNIKHSFLFFKNYL